MAKRILNAIKLKEISGVDKPAQEGARALLMKRQDGANPADCADGKKPKGKQPMDEEEKKRFDALEKSVSDLTASLTKKTEEHDALKAAKEEADILASFSGDEMSYYKGIKDDTKRVEFRKMSKTSREAAVALFKANDEEVEIEGIKIRKSETTPAMFAIAKAQSKKIADLVDEVAKSQTKTHDAEIRKRVAAEFSHLPGTEDERVAMLKAVEAITEPVAKKAALQVLKTAEDNAKNFFVRKGAGGDQPQVGSAEDELNKLAQDYQKTQKGMSFEKAYDVVIQQNGELYKRALDEGKIVN